MPHNLILFDIDHTLVKSAIQPSAHKRAFIAALHEVYGVNCDLEAIDCHGMTDLQIIDAALKNCGYDADAVMPKVEDCKTTMIRYFLEFLGDQDIVAMDGVQELLAELTNRGSFLGLVTGNVEMIGRTKLRKVGLNDYFPVGGFGGDDADRANLVLQAIRNAEQKFSRAFHCRIFVVGDTPRDVAAGRKAGVFTIGVATGIYPLEELKKSGAHYVLGSLKEAHKILPHILGAI